MKIAFNYLNNSSGQSLVELLVAIGLAAILLPALLTGMIASSQGRQQDQLRLEADGYLQEGVEAFRSVEASGWANIAADGTYHPAVNGTVWSLSSGEETIAGFFTRTIAISSVQRDGSGAIVASGGTADSSTKQVVTTVSWGTPLATSITATNYYSRVSGNKTITQTTLADFNQGVDSNTQETNTAGGEVALNLNNGTSDFGNEFIVTGTSALGTMSSSSTKTALRFTAQNSKTVGSVRVYIQAENGTSPTYRYGLQADNSGNPSGTYLGSGTLQANATGWKTINITPSVAITAGTTYHLVVSYGSGSVSAGKSIALRDSDPLNNLYPFSGATDSVANTLFNNGSSWVVQNGQPLYELDFNDGTFEGNPYETTTGTAISGATYVGEKFKVGGSNLVANAISFYVSKSASETPNDSLQVVLMDADTGVLIEQGVLMTAASATTSYVYKTYTFTTPRTLTANKNYRIYLKSPGSSGGRGYQVYKISTTDSANYTGLTYNGTNAVYSSSSNSGGTWGDNNPEDDIGGFKFTIAQSGAASGNFTSSTMDGGSSGAFNYLIWNGTIPANTTLKLQVAINNDNATWNFFGSDGSAGTYFDASGPIPLGQINGRYLRYKAYLTSTGVADPVLNDVSVNFSP